MAFSETFQDDLSVTVGNPTKASEYNNLANNTDALKERFVIAHHFNDSGTTNEDGFHKADPADPTWFYAKSKAGTPKYMCIYLGDDDEPRLHIANTTLAPTSAQGQVLVRGISGGNDFV